ncbi:NAD(P)/FAD-dependent oxidoreductase [Thiomicrorhabdus aquaedulcis]|uniref:NAD(P)/FAD-dependent oxidoreductase n=1 Tax=Thiomicrorhabdus aquaedulcis TaxID=2211106 RepID=UPI001E56570A|nr:NAD(P)-binding protein [Thiomicrorhabdus aquaedulcis]
MIGSGISGISAAWFLSQHHDVTVFEKNAKLGGHTNTSTVAVDAQNVAVDTGFIVFNRPNYPHLSAMLAHLHVATQNTEMTFSVSVNQGQLEYSGNNLNTMFAQRKNLLSPKHWKMISEILRFNKQAKHDLNHQPAHLLQQSLGDYLDQHHFNDHMRNHYLLPMAAAIWSCPLDTMMAFPIGSFLRFFENHGLLNIEDRPQWESVVGGSYQYIKAILKSARFNVKTDATVVGVTKSNGGLMVVLQDGTTEYFDDVVFGAHADETFVMLDDALKNDFRVLMPFQYQDNVAYLHSDTRLMPQRKLAWASWNYLRDTRNDASHPNTSQVAVTYWMNLLQNIAVDTPMLVTLNPPFIPKLNLTYQKIHYKHPVFDQAAMQAQTQLHTLQGKHNLWFCGSYFGYGFHEDGLASAVNLAKLWGINLPWESKEAQ